MGCARGRFLVLIHGCGDAHVRHRRARRRATMVAHGADHASGGHGGPCPVVNCAVSASLAGRADCQCGGDSAHYDAGRAAHVGVAHRAD